MRAGSPGFRPDSLTGTTSLDRDATCRGRLRAMPTDFAALSSSSQRTPIERLGMRLAFSSIGRYIIAVT